MEGQLRMSSEKRVGITLEIYKHDLPAVTRRRQTAVAKVQGDKRANKKCENVINGAGVLRIFSRET